MSTENRTVETPFAKMFPALGLAVIILLGAFLRFYQLGATSIGNEYYAAAVKSMLVSWHNFFFVAFEPGGSISVDKPPLGLWVEAASAYMLGLNGFALAFPNALAGTLSIPLLYALIKKQFGFLAGLTAALVLAVTPITIAAERNNTMDGLLVFVLLLSAWEVWKSVESGQFRYLLAGAFLIGLGFNIKMLQAYMVLPALYALYFFGAKHNWWKRITHLIAATVLLLVVSLSWALTVDAVPADSRPFIGSSTDNTVMELIIGHNGIKRILSGTSYKLMSDYIDSTSTSQEQVNHGDPDEVGKAGIFRLFTEPLASQASWLLPFALLGSMLALIVLGFPRSLTDQHLALILWIVWLLPMGLYFTFTSGLWHTYYLIMLGPALAALMGTAVWALQQIHNHRWILAALLSGSTLWFEIFILSAYPTYFIFTSVLMVLLWLASMALIFMQPRSWANGLLLLSLLAGPLLWSGLTTFNPQPEVDLPKAGPMAGQPGNGSELSSTQEKVLDYLLTNTNPNAYLFATLDSHGASPFILASGRAVLTFGGYIGNDNVITTTQLQEMISSGELRYIVDDGNLSQKAEISSWAQANCVKVQVPGVTVSAEALRQVSHGPRDQQFTNLYDCSSYANLP